jgi:ubiquinone biosynthesis protein
MHPGNIFVKQEGDDLKYILVDFGIMGTLHPSDQLYLAKNFTAFFARDYAQVATLHIQSGWVPANTRPDAFADAIRTVCEPIFARTANEVSIAELFLRLLETARQFNMVILPQLVLLQKTLMNVEGLARYLDPNIDIWAVAKPCIEKWYNKKRMAQLPQLVLRMLDNLLLTEQNALSNTEQLRMLDKQKTRWQNFAYGFACAGVIGLGYGLIIL